MIIPSPISTPPKTITSPPLTTPYDHILSSNYPLKSLPLRLSPPPYDHSLSAPHHHRRGSWAKMILVITRCSKLMKQISLFKSFVPKSLARAPLCLRSPPDFLAPNHPRPQIGQQALPLKRSRAFSLVHATESFNLVVIVDGRSQGGGF